ELAILALLAVAALASWRSTNAPVHERLALVLYMIEICVVSPSTWYSLDADLRSFIEVYLLAAVILLGTPRHHLRAWLLPALQVLLIPALIVVTQRRLVGSLRPGPHGRYQLVAMYLVSVNSRSPSCAPSRPMPDCLTPPNGAAGSDTRPRLSPTMPASSASDTRRPRLR